jgi:hypothetical protein
MFSGGDRGRPTALLQRAFRAHCVAVRQSTPEEWRRQLPCPPDSLPETMRVVMICRARTDEDLQRLAAHAPVLQVTVVCFASVVLCRSCATVGLRRRCCVGVRASGDSDDTTVATRIVPAAAHTTVVDDRFTRTLS